MKEMTGKSIFLFTLLFVIGFAMKTKGQCGNLVPNPSFEDYTQCPSTADQIGLASFWRIFKGDAEYYNACDTIGYVGVPLSTAGYQHAASGQAYAGVYTYGYRDYIGAQLITPLTAGTKYYISFKVSATLVGTLPFGSIKYVSNNIGILFTMSSSTNYPTTNYAHVYSGSIITDTTAWTTIRGSFVADTAYRYIVVGNFFDDNNTLSLLVNPSGTWGLAYYFVDDICVSTDSLECASGIVICDDNNNCTSDSCVSSQCIHVPITCEDNDACTTNNCDTMTGCVYIALVCEDNNACTIDFCDSLIGCVNTTINCTDSNTCTSDYCDSILGCLYTMIDCRDNNICTEDTCNLITGCFYLAISCDDSSICTKDVCDTLTGCFHSTVDCDDNNACTIDTCDGIIDCMHNPVDCNDNDSCTVDGCDSISGCTHTPFANCVGISSPQSEPPLVYPNPTSGLIIIESPIPISRIKVLNCFGQSIDLSEESKKSNSLISLDLSTKLPGVYFIIIQTRQSYSVQKIFLTH